MAIRWLFKNITRTNYITYMLRSFNTTSTSMEKALENLKTNPYYEKYAARIAHLQKTSPEEFMQRIEVQQKGKEDAKKKTIGPVDTRFLSIVFCINTGLLVSCNYLFYLI